MFNTNSLHHITDRSYQLADTSYDGNTMPLKSQ